MTLHQSQVLHGLLRYSCGFFAGRHLQEVCMELIQLGNMRHLQTGGRLEESCAYATAALKSSKPKFKILTAAGEKRPILISFHRRFLGIWLWWLRSSYH